MPKFVRSARGEVIDFNLLSIKAQIAAAPVPQQVKQRQEAIVAKDTGRQPISADAEDFLSISSAAAADSARSVDSE